MKKTFGLLAQALLAAGAVTTSAQVTAQGLAEPKRMGDDIVVAQAASTDMTDGEVRKVDKENAKLTLKHGEIKNLDMPPMTMVFAVKDKAMLDKLQPGDKVRFRAANDGGKLTVTEIQPAK
jgi:Cu/Ag efflux protein CusF